MKIIKISLKIAFLIAICLFGSVLGMDTMTDYKEEEINKLYIELDSEKEKNYQLELENKKLKTILSNYTIKERKEVDKYE